MKAGKCLIISGGELMEPAFYKRELAKMDFIIAADGGARHASTLGLTPQLVLGDFDTLTEAEQVVLEERGVKLERFPTTKDFTDTHLALLKALQLGYTDITIITALGGRLDHTLANIMLLALPEANQVSLRILDEKQQIFLIRDELLLEGEPGMTVSLLPLSEKVTGIKTSGLEYQVPQNTFIMGIPRGISNVMTEKQVRIQVETGLLLAIIPKDER